MSKHTPGPWSFGLSISDTCEFEVWAISEGGEVVAGEYGIEKFEDARLIAAAPELLEALVELVKQHKNLRAAESYPTVNSAATDAADSAIAKARGES